MTRVDKDQLNRFNRTWAEKGSTTIDNWALDEDDQLLFHTYPRASLGSAVFLELRVSLLPTRLVDVTRDILVPERYALVLRLFVQGWALDEDDPAADPPGRGAAFVEQAYKTLGLSIQGSVVGGDFNEMGTNEQRKRS